MASPATSFIRKIILLGNALTFLLLGGFVLFSTQKAAYFYGYTLNGADGFNEFRAVYIGFWFGLTILFSASAWKIDISLIGDVALIMVLLQSLGRLLSFAIDGIPGTRFVVFFFLEIISSLLGLIMRPQKR
jgi:hypothetical protein